MGKAQRNRRRRQQRQTSAAARSAWSPPPDAVRGGTQAAADLAEQISSEIRMPCRLTYMNDHLFTGGNASYPVADIAEDGSLIPDLSDTIDPVPVALLEPTQLLGIQDLNTGTMHEARIEGMISAGFHRVPDAPVWAALPADGWGLHRTTDGVMLRDQLGGVWAEGIQPVDPAWASAATSYGSVAVFFGPKLGIRLPAGKTAATYSVADQVKEFRQGRREGLCVVGSVKWHPVPSEETMDWVLLGGGAFGQPLPLAYVPLWQFTPFGGPEAFGFADLSDEIPMAQGLVADVSPTDVDLWQPHLDADLNLVAGYHASDGRTDPAFIAWRQAAHAHGRVLVVTGRQDMPCGPGASLERAYEVLRDSRAAIVPISDTPRR